MRFAADESVDGRTVARLIADGHDLILARKELSGKLDPQVLEAANDRGCILITEDKDFGMLVHRMRQS